MSDEGRSGGSGERRLNRREFLAAGVASASMLAFGGIAFARSRGSEVAESARYRNSDIRVVRANGRRELYIDGEHVRTIDTNGVYRADGFVFSPEPTLKDLGMRMIDARRAYTARGVRSGGGI
jgi:hypothetical protein